MVNGGLAGASREHLRTFGGNANIMKLQDAEIMVRNLMGRHGIGSWDFDFTRGGHQRWGTCYWERCRITLSSKMVELNDVDAVEQAALHEIAHALAGRGTGHGKVWKAKCKDIGYRWGRITNESQIVLPKAKLLRGVCPGCRKVYLRSRRSSSSCSDCDPKYNPDFKLEWHEITSKAA